MAGPVEPITTGQVTTVHMTSVRESIGPLAVSSVEVRAGGMSILEGINARLFPGELCALIGPSGAGKSTLIKVLLGLRSTHKGEVTLGGRPLGDASAPVGYVPQHDALHLSLTPRQALRYAAELRLPTLDPQTRAERITAVAEQVGLKERLDTPTKRLSGGQQKRVSVALELLTSPPILILDEPTSGLDPGLESRMTTLFKELAEGGRIVLVATHAMESLNLAHVVVVLVGGRIAFAGSPKDALIYFKSETFPQIFHQLPKIAPEAWGRRWQRAPESMAFLKRAGPISPPATSTSSKAVAANAPAPPQNNAPQAAPKAEASPPSTPEALSPAQRLAALKAARQKGGDTP